MNIADEMDAANDGFKPIPKINIDNVVSFLLPDWFNKKFDIKKELPTIAPPFEDAIYFWKFRADTQSYAGIEVGVYVHSERTENGWVQKMEVWDNQVSLAILPMHYWVYCDEEGVFVGKQWYVQEWISDEDNNDDKKKWMAEEAEFAGLMVLFANALMHCKNVTLEETPPPPPKLARKQMKEKGIPKITYHVLMVDPMKKVLRHEGGMNRGNDLPTALHICRGHFKDYREGNGLFGKYKDRFWWPQQLRGEKEGGVALKDYKISEIKDGDE